MIDPKPFSDEEDRAVGMGINSFSDRNVRCIIFWISSYKFNYRAKKYSYFSPEKKLSLNMIFQVYSELSQIQKPVISILDNLGLMADSRIGKPEQQILKHMNEMFKVEMVSESDNVLNENTKFL